MSAPKTNLRCIVTGGSAGLGRVIAETLANQGNRVLIVGRDAARLAPICHANDAVESIAADVRDLEECKRIVAQASQLWNGIDVLVNVVGESDRGRVDELSAETVHRLIDANVVTALHMAIAAADSLAHSEGVVVNIGSIGGRVGARYLGGYAIAKHALAGITQQLRLEWKDRGIHVGLVSPGPIRRNDEGNRYADKIAQSNVPDSASKPGGGTRVKGLDPQVVADAVVKMIHRRTPDVVLPGYLRLMIALGHLSPRLGDWLLLKMTSKK